MQTTGIWETQDLESKTPIEALPGVLGNRGTKAFISEEQGNKDLKMREQGSKGNFGEQGAQEIRILILGTKWFISGEQGNRYLPWEDLPIFALWLLVCLKVNQIYIVYVIF